LDSRRLRTGFIAVVAVGAAAALGVTLVSGGPALMRAAAGLPAFTLVAVLGLNLLSWLGEVIVFAALSGRRSPRDLAHLVAVYVGGGFPGLVTPFGSGAIPGWTWGLTTMGLAPGEAAAIVGARALVTSVFFVVAGSVGVAALPARAAGGASGWAGVGGLALTLAAAAWIATHPDAVARLARRVLSARLVTRLLGAERAQRVAERTGSEVAGFADGLRALVRERPRALAVALAGLLVSRACLLAILPVLLAGLGWRGDVAPVLLTVIAVWAVASASPTPGGSGAVEAAMTLALSRLTPLETAGAAALLWRGLTFYFDMVAGWLLFSWLLARARGRSRDAGAAAAAPRGSASI